MVKRQYYSHYQQGNSNHAAAAILNSSRRKRSVLTATLIGVALVGGNLVGNHRVVMDVLLNGGNGTRVDHYDYDYGAPGVASASDTSSTNRSSSPTSKQNSKQNTTLILGFANDAYKEVALDWYQSLETLGYTEHWAIATDDLAGAFFEEHGLRFDYQYSSSNSTTSNTTASSSSHSFVWNVEQCPQYASLNPAQQRQTARRSMFGGRWHYIARQLQAGYHVLVTDVDNLWQTYLPMASLERSDRDAFHALGGDLDAFPRNIYRQQGFTLCGGMSWWRSTPSILKFVQVILEKCGCAAPHNIGCDCFCDDQVVLNNLYAHGEYRVTWNQSDHQRGVVAKAPSQVYWDGFDGVCPKTGHKIRVWDRHLLWRGSLRTFKEEGGNPNNNDVTVCPDITRNWIAMPAGIEDRMSSRALWNQHCGASDNIPSAQGSGPSIPKATPGAD